MILLTGASGWLGGWIGRELSARGVAWRPLEARLGEVEAGELSGVSLVIHAAARTPRPGRADESYAINVSGTRQLLELCARVGVSRFVYVSSMGVKFPTPYSRTKLAAEETVKRGAVPWLILRPAHLYGANEHWSETFAVERRRRFRFVVGLGRNPVAVAHVQDCARAIVDAALSGIAGQTFNIVEPEIAEVQYLRVLRRAIGARFHIVPVPGFVARWRLGARVVDEILAGYRMPGVEDWPYVPGKGLEAGLREAYVAVRG